MYVNNACHLMSPKNNIYTMPSHIMDIILIEMWSMLFIIGVWSTT